jgi:succinate-semialdehyde dehydrogenase / glutarate-semialdehyde dehydrogenase
MQILTKPRHVRQLLCFEIVDADLCLLELMALKYRHAGQACITANRVYVQKGVYDKFAQVLAEKAKALKVGHGASEGVTMGPVTTPRSLDKAEAHVADAKKLGGQIVTGGNKLHGQKGYDGYFFEPTLITGAKKEMMISQEEQFSPILALFEFDTEEEAVQKANDTSMGLASCELISDGV